MTVSTETNPFNFKTDERLQKRETISSSNDIEAQKQVFKAR